MFTARSIYLSNLVRRLHYSVEKYKSSYFRLGCVLQAKGKLDTISVSGKQPIKAIKITKILCWSWGDELPALITNRLVHGEGVNTWEWPAEDASFISNTSLFSHLLVAVTVNLNEETNEIYPKESPSWIHYCCLKIVTQYFYLNIWLHRPITYYCLASLFQTIRVLLESSPIRCQTWSHRLYNFSKKTISILVQENVACPLERYDFVVIHDQHGLLVVMVENCRRFPLWTAESNKSAS